MRSTTITIHTIGDHPEYYLREVSKQLQAGATEGKLDRDRQCSASQLGGAFLCRRMGSCGGQ
jgi:hypothetical protein